MADLLLELFSEEIPARMQDSAELHLLTRIMSALESHSIAAQQWELFSTPRRLAIWLKGLSLNAQANIERKGPRVDAPQAAIDGFLRSTGLTLSQLEQRDGVYFAAMQQKQRPMADVLKESIEKILAEFPWPKSMRWGGREERWVRPLHSILCILDSAVVPVQFAGVTAGNITYGHRFLAPAAITITSPEAYRAALESAFVIPCRDARKDLIRQEAARRAAALGLDVRPDEGLLEEVTGLVEYPTLLIGSIDAGYMDLPSEVLVSEMRGHQKYFALQHKNGTLADQFIITSNMQGWKDGGKAVIAGNERVLRARLADGRFFWDQDRKKPLEQWAEGLKTVTYHAKIGTIAQKVERVTYLARVLAEVAKAKPEPHIGFVGINASIEKVERAALLAKADLVTGMVGEFPELQGVMGRYYAIQQKEAPEVADAIRDHYKPQGPNDAVPQEPTAVCVALADKLDTLIGMFAIGEKPTGSKDPFALRRSALGVIRIVLENGIRLKLADIISAHPHQGKSLDIPELVTFFHDRLKVQLKDQGLRHDVIDAVVDSGDDDLVRIVARAKALQAFLATDDGANLLAAYKRAANILKIEEKKDKTTYAGAPAPELLTQTEEKALFGSIGAVQPAVDKALGAEDYTGAMQAIASLRAPVDAFFDKTLVNDKDPVIRANRLKLLTCIRGSLDNIANFTLLEG